jgi:predicted nucleic acid-binding protein
MALRACLDTRFFFTYYQETPSWTRRVVEASRQQRSRVVSSTVTIIELVSLMTADVGLDAVRVRIQSAKDARIEFISPSEAVSHQAGEILLKDRSLPVADAIIAATAIAHAEGRVYTDDPHFQKINGIHTIWGRA